jgi:hypothetical protein
LKTHVKTENTKYEFDTMSTYLFVDSSLIFMARLVMGELSPKAGTGTKEFAISSDG